MSQFTVSESRHARHRPDLLRPRLRALLAALAIAGLAALGTTALAAPAAASEETSADDVIAVEPAPAEQAEIAEIATPVAEEDVAFPDVGVSVVPLSCSTDRNGRALVTLTGLDVAGIVTYAVEGAQFSVGGALDEFADVEEIEVVGMPPGNYYAYVEWHPLFGEEEPPAPAFDWVGFVIEPCQPAVAVDVTECTAAGGTGTAHVTLSSLVAGVEYVAWVTDVGAPDGTLYGEPQWVVVEASAEGTGGAELTFSSLPGGRDYTVWVDGLWEAIPPWEEPPFIGNGGNFDPVETVELFADADFTLQPCPAAPAKSGTVTPALAATGPDGPTGLLLSALTLLALGGAALSARRLVPSRARKGTD